MLKTTISLQVLAANELLGTRVLAANKVGDVEGGDGSKCVKLKIGRLKSQKLSKSQKLAKSGKKSPKNGNFPNFNAKEAGPNFLTPSARKTFNCLWLAFIKALILWHFDPEYHV